MTATMIRPDGATLPADPVSGHGAGPSPHPPQAIPPATPAEPSPAPPPPGTGGGETRRRPAPPLGPYSQLKQRLDRRTRLGRRATAFERALIAQIGGAPSAAEAALIRLAVTLDARIELMRERLLATEAGDERAERQMLAWCNTLARTLRTLGLKAAPKRAPTLADIIADCGAERGSQ